MASFNKVMLLGNLTRDPEKRVTLNNLTITKIGLAVNRRYTTQDGQQREETTFVDLDAFGRQAEVLAQYCQKGSPLFVEGRLKLDTWQDRESGQNRSKMSVVIENFQLLPSGGGGGGGRPGGDDPYEASSPPRRQAAPRNTPPPAQSSPNDTFGDDDVPF